MAEALVQRPCYLFLFPCELVDRFAVRIARQYAPMAVVGTQTAQTSRCEPLEYFINRGTVLTPRYRSI